MANKKIYVDNKKTCSMCLEHKMLNEFRLRKNKQPLSRCIICTNKVRLKHYHVNKEKYLGEMKEYRKSLPKEKQREYYQTKKTKGG